MSTNASPSTSPVRLALPPDDRQGGVYFLHRCESASVDRNGNVAQAWHVTDRHGAPAVFVVSGASSYTHQQPGRWYQVRFGGRCPAAPYDGRVASASVL